MSNFWLNQYFLSVHQGSLSIVFFLGISPSPYFIEAVFSSSDTSQVNMMDIFPPSLLPLKMWPRLTHILFDKLANYLCQENMSLCDIDNNEELIVTIQNNFFVLKEKEEN